MDLVDYESDRFGTLRTELCAFAEQAGIRDAHFVPISALHGDNVVDQTAHMPWYDGPTLLELLEDIEVERDLTELPLRFPIQGVLRPAANADRQLADFRGYAGRVETGSIGVGDTVTVLPSGLKSRVRAIHTYDRNLELAIAPQSIALLLEDQIDVSRGDIIVGATRQPKTLRAFTATLCWLSDTPLDPSRKYLLKHTTRTVKALISSVDHRVNIQTLARESGADTLSVNEIGGVQMKVQQPLALDAYGDNRATGSFLLIDEASNNTVAAGMIEHG